MKNIYLQNTAKNIRRKNIKFLDGLSDEAMQATRVSIFKLPKFELLLRYLFYALKHETKCTIFNFNSAITFLVKVHKLRPDQQFRFSLESVY